jgi:predicted transposase/invertase (TIGR01784 family)
MKDPVINKAFGEWEDISHDAHTWAEYESRRKALLDETAAVREAQIREQKARLEGQIEGKLDMVRNLLSHGVDVDAICKASGLSPQEVEEMKKHLQ